MISVSNKRMIYLRYDIHFQWMMYACDISLTDIISYLQSKYIIQFAVYHIALAIYHYLKEVRYARQ